MRSSGSNENGDEQFICYLHVLRIARALLSHEQIKAALPGKAFKTYMSAGDVDFVFDDALSGAEVTTLTNTYNAWNPDATVGIPIIEEQLAHKVETISGGRIQKTDYYTVDNPPGFSGFSGLGKTDFYNYQGNSLLGFSSVRYDTAGAVIEVIKTEYFTDTGKKISKTTKVIEQ